MSAGKGNTGDGNVDENQDEWVNFMNWKHRDLEAFVIIRSGSGR